MLRTDTGIIALRASWTKGRYTVPVLCAGISFLTVQSSQTGARSPQILISFWSVVQQGRGRRPRLLAERKHPGGKPAGQANQKLYQRSCAFFKCQFT